jgi:hypothetical protein
MPNHPSRHLERWLQVISAFLAPGAAVVLLALSEVPPGAPPLTWPVVLRALLVCVVSAGAAAQMPALARKIDNAGRHRPPD